MLQAKETIKLILFHSHSLKFYIWDCGHVCFMYLKIKWFREESRTRFWQISSQKSEAEVTTQVWEVHWYCFEGHFWNCESCVFDHKCCFVTAWNIWVQEVWVRSVSKCIPFTLSLCVKTEKIMCVLLSLPAWIGSWWLRLVDKKSFFAVFGTPELLDLSESKSWSCLYHPGMLPVYTSVCIGDNLTLNLLRLTALSSQCFGWSLIKLILHMELMVFFMQLIHPLAWEFTENIIKAIEGKEYMVLLYY